MSKTLVQIREEIKRLEKQAAAVRTKEVAGVVARMKEAIRFYGLTARDLFDAKTAKAPGAAKAGTKTRAKAAKKSPLAPKYRDPQSGKGWSGRGRRPEWFIKAVEGGAKAEDLAV